MIGQRRRKRFCGVSLGDIARPEGTFKTNPQSAFARTGLSPSSFLKIWKQAIGVGTCLLNVNNIQQQVT